MTIEDAAKDVSHRLIGPHSRYSKIGRIRRERLRAEIVAELLVFYNTGKSDERHKCAWIVESQANRLDSQLLREVVPMIRSHA